MESLKWGYIVILDLVDDEMQDWDRITNGIEPLKVITLNFALYNRNWEIYQNRI